MEKGTVKDKEKVKSKYNVKSKLEVKFKVDKIKYKVKDESTRWEKMNK